MLIYSGASKIHVCAPSNAAVDEILARVAEKGLLTLDQNVLSAKGLLLRLGAQEYDPTDTVKQHTMDERLKQVMNEGKEYDLK